MTAEANALADIISLDRERRLRSDKSVGPEVATERWPCRVPTCIEYISVGPTAVFVLGVLNAELTRRRDKIIQKHEVCLCTHHGERWREQQRERRR